MKWNKQLETQSEGGASLRLLICVEAVSAVAAAHFSI